MSSYVVYFSTEEKSQCLKNYVKLSMSDILEEELL